MTLDLKALETEVLPRLRGDSDGISTDDPEKIWVVLQYPDSLKVTASKLHDLLEALRTNSDESLAMDQFEWTLSGRVNCKEDQQSSAEETDEALAVPIVQIEPAITGYYSVTAPVYKTVIPSNPKHSVACHTETVIVDMRYKFRSKQLRVKDSSFHNICVDTSLILNRVADKVRDLVTQYLISSSDLEKYRVYVLKPQNQTSFGVSPRRSMEITESLGFPATGYLMGSPPPEKKPKLEI